MAVRLDEISVDDAVQEAVRYHRGEVDLNGGPYVLHALSVGLRGKTNDERIVGFLCDLVGVRKDYLLSNLALTGVTRVQLTALKLLVHQKGVKFDDYIQAIANSGNALAIAVKINDLEDMIVRAEQGNHPRKKSQYKKVLSVLRG